MNKRIFIWLLIPVVILVIVFTIVMITGKDNSANTIKENTISNNENLEYQKEWGVTDRISASNKNGIESFLISLPDHVGTYQGTGRIGQQADGSLIIVDGQDKTISQEVANLSEVFPTYFTQVESVLKGYYRMRGADFKFEITAQSEVKINGYDMVKFSGTHSYSYEQEPVNCNWVAYATQLKSNGAYVYWMVLDTHGNKTSNSDIAEIAQKMAASLKEE